MATQGTTLKEDWPHLGSLLAPFWAASAQDSHLGTLCPHSLGRGLSRQSRAWLQPIYSALFLWSQLWPTRYIDPVVPSCLVDSTTSSSSFQSPLRPNLGEVTFPDLPLPTAPPPNQFISPMSLSHITVYSTNIYQMSVCCYIVCQALETEA